MTLIRSALAGLLALLAATTASAQQFPTVPAHSVIGRLGIPGDSGPSQAIPFATLAGQIGVNGIPSVTIESAGGGCTVNDNTAALLAAVNSVSVLFPVRVLFPNNCTYNFRQANAINFSKAGVYLECAERRATALQYQPTSDGTFLKWSNGINVMFNGGISKCSLLSTDTTHAKVMAEWFDVSTFHVRGNIIGGGSIPTGGGQLIGGAAGSTGIYSHGRDTTIIADNIINAQIPIRIGMNPHTYLSTDHYHYFDNYLIGDIGSGTHPIILVDPGVAFTSTTFDGVQTWNGGADAFRYVDTAAAALVGSITAAGSGYTAGVPVSTTGGTCSTPIQILPLTVNGSGGIVTASIANPGVCSVVPSAVAAVSGGATFNVSVVAGFQLAFANVRSEQGVNPASYTFNIQPTGQLRELSITNSVMDAARCGAFLKNTFFTTISQSAFPGNLGCTTAVNATSANSNDMVAYANNYWLTGVIQDHTGLTAVWATSSPTGTSSTVPPGALYSSTITGTAFSNLSVTNSFVQAGTNGTVSLTTPAAVGSALNNVWGSVAGTIATSATSPIVENATTGAISCATCVTSSGGGPITGTAPISVSAAGNVSFVPPSPSGGVLFNNAGSVGTTAANLSGQIFVGTSAAPAFVTPSGDIAAISNTGLVTFTSTVSAGGPTGSATIAPIITYDAKGRLTAVSSATITPAIGSITGLGANVATALATAVGSAGGPVTFNGAGGTPSSIVLTNATGTAASMTAGAATSAANTAIADDTTTNATMFPTWVTANTGNLPQKVTSTKWTFNPSTGAQSFPIHAASGALTFQSNGTTFAGSISTSQQWAFGANVTPDTTVTVNNNTVAAVAPSLATQLHTVGADGAIAGLYSDSYGAGQVVWGGRLAAGTAASKTAVGAGGSTLTIAGYAWDGSTYGINSTVDFLTLNAQTGSDHSGYIKFATTPSGSASRVAAAWVTASGSLSIGSSKVESGAGTVNLKAQTFASLTACVAGIEGTMAAVTDSSTATWGATVTGSSTNHVLAYCDGTNWTVAGK